MEQETSPPDWKLAVEKLTQGRRSANLLGSLLQEMWPSGGHGPNSAARPLMEELLGSISRALEAIMDITETRDKRSEISDGKRKSPPLKRGAHRRRATPYSWTRITSKTPDDGYTWRKYGQKEILSTKFPRSYYRCTHKQDRGCQVTRQVQRSEGDPSTYVITYMGEHTCRDPVWATSHQRNSHLISFGSNTFEVQQPAPLPSSLPSSKQQPDEEVIGNLTSGSSPSGCFVLPSPTTLEVTGAHVDQVEVGAATNQEDVTSDLLPFASSLDLDFWVDGIEIGNFIDFDEDDHFEN